MIAGDVMNPIPFLTPDERQFHIQRRQELNERYETEYNKRMVMISQQQKPDMNKEYHPIEIEVESVANSPAEISIRNDTDKISLEDNESIIVNFPEKSHVRTPSLVSSDDESVYENVESNRVSDKNAMMETQKPVKICSWNVAGIRSTIAKVGLQFLEEENADIITLQKTKCAKKRLPQSAYLQDYHCYFVESTKSGYEGVGLYSKVEPMSIKYGLNNVELDEEGRGITAEYKKFYVVAVCAPTAGDNLKFMPEKLERDAVFKEFVKTLDKVKPVIIAGDLNLAGQEIDIAYLEANRHCAGFTYEERRGLQDLLNSGFVDTYRQLYPRKVEYTFWPFGPRRKDQNLGWRLDSFLTSNRIFEKVLQVQHHTNISHNNHWPIT